MLAGEVASLRKGCCKSSNAVALFSGSFCKHESRNDESFWETWNKKKTKSNIENAFDDRDINTFPISKIATAGAFEFYDCLDDRLESSTRPITLPKNKVSNEIFD